MPLDGAFIDTNLLILLVVGSVDLELVDTHPRTQIFTPEDYDRLCRIINGLKRVFVTPNTLTETSNLLKQPRDKQAIDRLRILIEVSEEIVIASAAAARNSAFARLGLTDTALLEVVSEERPLITVDLELYGAALAAGKGKEVAFNFTHSQDL